jgi:HAD superfamily hydrolase (TIGR01509 family)
MAARIVAVFFDFDHTLGVDHRLEERVLRLLAERHCLSVPSDDDIATALAQFRTGVVSLGTMLTDAFSRWGYNGQVLDEYKAEALRMLPESLVPMPGATQTVTELERADLVVAILSNGWTELQHAKASLIGFEGPVFASEEIGAWKPGRRAFEIAADRTGVALTQSLYIGDSPETDVAGAKNAGMFAAWANLEDGTYPADAVAPDFTVSALEELIGIAAGRAGQAT